MKITATQRTFLTTHLGVKPRPKKLMHIRSGSEKTDDSITEAFNDYMRREGKVLESLTALELVDGAANLMAAFENEVAQVQSRVKTAVRDGAEEILKLAYKELDAIKERARKEVETSEKNPTFIALRAAADAVLTRLESHLQRAHVQTLITQGRTALTEADTANEKKRYPESLTKVEAARVAGVTGTDRADKFNVYRVARAPAAAAVGTMKGMYANNDLWVAFDAQLTQADADATLAANKYAQATTAVGTIKTGMGNQLKTWTSGGIQASIDKIKNLPQLAFVATDHQQLKDWLAEVPGKAAALEWAAMALMSTRAGEIGQAAFDKATRRQEFVDARKKATDAIALLKPNTAMAAKVLQFETLLTGTIDPLAAATSLRFMEANALCEQLVKDCAAQAGVAAAAKKFKEDRAALGQRLVTLKTLPAAAQMTAAVTALDGLQAEADKKAAPDVSDWAGGLEWLARLQADLTAAEAQALTMAGPMAAQEAGKTVAKSEDVTKAVELVRAEAVKLDVEPFKALLAVELKGIADGCKLALDQAKAGHLDPAKQALATANDLLAKGFNIQALQKNFDTALALAVERKKNLVLLSKTGSFTAIDAKVQLIEPMLTHAKEAAKTRDYTAASAALAQATEAERKVEEAVESIKAYDLRAAPLALRAKGLKTDGETTGPIEKLLSDAALALAALRFADAIKLLDQAEAKMEELKVKKLAKANPNDPKIAATAEAMLKLDGGKELLDNFVAGLTGEVSFDLIAKLAEKRFGIVMESDAGDKTASAQSIWAVMASLPASHATKNPSLKNVKREGPNGGAAGAFYGSTKLVEMNGRPNTGETENFDSATRNKALGLPLDHDNSKDPYAPKDDQGVDSFSMTALHEVGHAVDDRLGFMVSKAGQAAFGGWVQYKDLGVIATAVATAKNYDPAYVLQLIKHAGPDAAPMPKDHPGGEAKWTKAKQAVDAWYATVTGEKLWYSFSVSSGAAIDGVVYQEAYKNNWVSYVLAERSKGVTGYQWRAPGEWFAELYMCWYGKKLKPNHPFAPWLQTL